MPKKDKPKGRPGLRQRAEDSLNVQASPDGEAAITPEEALRLVHELQVHQVELEMQNEELRRAEEELRLSRDRYSSLYDFAPVGYVTLDAQGTIVKANLTIARLLGVERGRLVDQALTRYVAPEGRTAFEAYVQVARESEVQVPLDVRLVRADGTTFPVHVDGLALEALGSAPQLRLSVSDISVLQATMDALRQSEEHFRTLVLHIPDVTWTVDERGRLTYISPNVEGLTGFTAEEVLHGKPTFWQERIHPEDLDSALRAFEGLPKGGDIYEVEYRFQRKDGETIWIQSRSVRTFEVNQQTRTDGILSDVTVRKRIEEYLRGVAAKLERQSLEQAMEVRRLEVQQDVMTADAAVGRRAATVIHEINNPLAGILNSFRLVRKGISPDHPHYQFLDLINREMERLAQLVRQLYGTKQLKEQASAHCDPRRVLNEVLMIMTGEVQSRQIKVHVRGSGGMRVQISENSLKQALYNLYTNALKASSAGGEIYFDIEPLGAMMRIAVIDHGTGISARDLPHIFEPFTRGLADHSATGLHVGLSTVRTLIEAAGGEIKVETQEGRGTTFILLIPVWDSGEIAR